MFAMVMGQVDGRDQAEVSVTMVFEDDIVIYSESSEVEESLERQRYALERRGMKVSQSKKDFMCVKGREDSRIVRVRGIQVDEFNHHLFELKACNNKSLRCMFQWS